MFPLEGLFPLEAWAHNVRAWDEAAQSEFNAKKRPNSNKSKMNHVLFRTTTNQSGHKEEHINRKTSSNTQEEEVN